MTDSNKELLGNLKRILGFGSTGANKNVITDANGDLTIGDILTDEDIQEKVEEFANALAFAINSIRLNITADQDILSYADDDECTITATLTQAGAPLSNKAISLYKNDVLWDTLTTDSNGEVTKTYVSEGVGDIEIKAKYGSFLQETYVLEDLLLYRSSVTNNDTFDVALPNHFQITQTVTRNSSSSSYCYGLLTNYQYGVLREKGSLSVRIGTNNPFADNNTTIIQLNTPTVMTYEFDNGLHKCSANNTTVSGTNTQYSIGSFTGMTITQYTVTDLKIKPL